MRQIEHSSQFVKEQQRRRVVVYLMHNVRFTKRLPPIIFAGIIRRINALQLCRRQFSQRNFVADFLQAKCDFRWKSAVLRFWPTSGGLGTTYDVHLGLIEKRVVDFLLVLIELFSLGVTAESLRAKRDRRSAISLQCGQFDPKFEVEGVAPDQLFLHR